MRQQELGVGSLSRGREGSWRLSVTTWGAQVSYGDQARAGASRWEAKADWG